MVQPLIVDTHTHFMPFQFLERAGRDPDKYFVDVRKAEDGYYLKTRFWSLSKFMEYGPFQEMHYDWDTRVAYMDEYGITTQVLTTVQSLNYFWAEQELAAEVAALANDAMAEAIDAYPGRFSGLASVPIQHVDAAIGELQRAVKDLGLRGVQLLSNVNGESLDEERFRPFFQEVERLDVPVFIHPYGTLNEERLSRNFLVNVVGWPSEQAVAMGGLILSGVLDEFPGLRFHLAHGGGTFLFVVGRIAKGVQVMDDLQLQRDVREYLNQIWVDTILHDDAAIRYAIETVGPDHVMFGTDWPFWMQDLKMIERLQAIDGVDDETRKRIFGTNAQALYNLS